MELDGRISGVIVGSCPVIAVRQLADSHSVIETCKADTLDSVFDHVDKSPY